MSDRSKTIDELMADHGRLTRAMRAGVRDALRRHKLLGESIVVWQDGKVVEIPPEKIPVSLPRNGRRKKTR